MPVFLAVLGLAVVVLIVISALMGFGDMDAGRMVEHMYWGIATALLGLLAHTLTFFFFIGTAKAIREACRDHQPAWPFIGEANRFRSKIAGRAMLADLVLIVQPVLGAAVYSGQLHTHWHLFGFWTLLGVHLWAYGTELKFLGLNNVLLAKVGDWKATGELPHVRRAGVGPNQGPT